MTGLRRNGPPLSLKLPASMPFQRSRFQESEIPGAIEDVVIEQVDADNAGGFELCSVLDVAPRRFEAAAEWLSASNAWPTS